MTLKTEISSEAPRDGKSTANAAQVGPEILVANLAALWAVDPATAAELDAQFDAELNLELAAELDAELDAVQKLLPLPLIPTRSDRPTVAVPTPDGRTVLLHSRVDPVGEARRLTGRLLDGNDESARRTGAAGDLCAVFVFGCGLGYHITAIAADARAPTIWIFEPDLRVLWAAFGVTDFSKLLLDKKLHVITRLDKSKLFSRWMPHLPSFSVGQRMFDHPPSLQRAGVFHREAKNLVEEFLSFGKTTINTLIFNSRRTCENLAVNVPWYVASRGVGHLANATTGQPAIIVAAGPSLRKNKHLLARAKDHAVVIAVQTIYKQLLEMSVEPHFVTALDYHDISSQFFRDIPPSTRTQLVAEPKATPTIFELNPNPVSLLGNDYIEHLLREMNLNRPKLPAGATVAHLAFYLAEYLGCDPIIFVGQDLGFSDGLAYSPGSSYDSIWRPELGLFGSLETMQWQRIVRDRKILREVPDINGHAMYTEERLFTYLQQFERDFLASTRTIIDASEGGAAKRGTVVMSLDSALDRYRTQPLDLPSTGHGGMNWTRLPEAVECLETRRNEAEEIKTISLRTLELLRALRTSLQDQTSAGRIIAQIDPLRKRINALNMTYEQITQLTQQSELKRFTADHRIAAAGVEGVERQRRQIDRDVMNVEHVVDAAGVFVSLIERCIAVTRETADRKATVR